MEINILRFHLLWQDLNILSQTRINGSAVINGCEAEMLCALTLDGNTSVLQMRTECQPKLKVEFIFRHNLPMLKEISEESKLSITVGKQTNYNIDILLKSGTCSIEVKGDINADNKLQWKMVAENKCKTIQVMWINHHEMKFIAQWFLCVCCAVIERSFFLCQLSLMVDVLTIKWIRCIGAMNYSYLYCIAYNLSTGLYFCNPQEKSRLNSVIHSVWHFKLLHPHPKGLGKSTGCSRTVGKNRWGWYNCIFLG